MDARPASPHGAAREPLLWLRRQIALLRRWRLLFALAAGGGFALALLAIAMIADRYAAVAEVMIDPGPERAAAFNPPPPTLPADSSRIDTEVEVLKSRPLAEKAVDALGLDRDPAFSPEAQPDLRSWLAGASRRRNPRDAAADRLTERLKIARVGFTSVIAITARAGSAEAAARVADAVARLYLQQQRGARMLSPARPPETPYFPDRLALALVAGVAAAVLGLAVVGIADMWEDGLYAAEDLERRLALPCLGLLPVAGPLSDKARGPALQPAMPDQPFSAFAEAVRALRATVFARRRGGPIRTLAVTSALAGEGKTAICLGLGRMAARTGASVVVVDCDFRRRSMNRLLAEPPKLGLVDVLAGGAALEAVLIPVSGLTLLPLGDEFCGDEAALESQAMDRVLEALRRRFSLVLLDTAPVLLVAETRTLAAKADATLLLARWRKTPASAVAGATSILSHAGAHVIGAALTQVDGRFVDRRDGAYAALDDPFHP